MIRLSRVSVVRAVFRVCLRARARVCFVVQAYDFVSILVCGNILRFESPLYFSGNVTLLLIH